MNRESWARIEDLFHQALQVPLPHRDQWLEFQCGNDKETLQQVKELLSADNEGHNPLEKEMRKAAAGVILQYFGRGA